jgi:hypothetical protein
MVRIRARDRRAILVQSYLDGIRIGSQYLWLGFFAFLAFFWSGYRLFHLGILGDQICFSGSPVHVWVDLRDNVFLWQPASYSYGLSEPTEAWCSGSQVMDWFLTFVDKHQNYVAIFVGAVASITAAAIGFWGRRPIVKQAVESSRFKTLSDGFEVLLRQSSDQSDAIIKRMGEHILYLEGQVRSKDEQIQIKDDYEVVLLKRLNDARQQLVEAGLFHDPSS